ncbi:MAG: YcaQ family DNA glycosylase [Anaerolinea sp.]|nr:YcaQ family DNA glycosylase [Anaerolinea sp.]
MSVRTITPETVRRVAIRRQHLAADRQPPTPAGILNVARDLGCLQLDPISAVSRSHTLVVFSRVGAYDLKALDHLQWQERALFEYWAHVASIVLTEDFPIYDIRMRNYCRGEDGWSQRVREWVALNQQLHDFILSEIREKGALMSRDIEKDAHDPDTWVSSGWTSGRNVSRMLDYLWSSGVIMVAGRKGGQKVWDLTERFLPDWTPRAELTEREVTRQAAQRALRALGVAAAPHIRNHFIRGRYPDLPAVLDDLEREGAISRVKVGGDKRVWYIHNADLPLLDAVEAGEFNGRTVLLSPFDNLICDRARTELLWNFYYRMEIYVPADKREYGYYVLPILHGDRFIGRVDSNYDKKSQTLQVHNVYAEADAPLDAGRAVRGAIEELGTFLGAKAITYGNVPDGWRAAIKT